MNLLTNKSSIYILGIPLLLLALFLIFNNIKVNDAEFVNDFNPYLKPLPEKYIDIIERNGGQDSTFFSAVIESDFSRELVILKASPNAAERLRKFTLKLFTLNSTGDKKTFQF